MKEIRKALGLSQKGMARALRLKGTDGRAIRQWESGERVPSGPVTLCYEMLEKERTVLMPWPRTASGPR